MLATLVISPLKNYLAKSSQFIITIYIISQKENQFLFQVVQRTLLFSLNAMSSRYGPQKPKVRAR